MCQQVPDRNALGTFPHNASDHIEYLTYRQMREKITTFATSLQQICKFPAGSKVIICAANSAEWLMTDLACVVAGLVAVPLHTLLTTSTVAAAMELIQPAGVCCDQSTFSWFEAYAAASSSSPDISDQLSPAHLIPLIDLSCRSESTLKAEWAKYSFHTLATTARARDVGAGAGVQPNPLYPALQGSDLSSIMFTSGSTGKATDRNLSSMS